MLFSTLVRRLITRLVNGLHAFSTDESTQIHPFPLHLQVILCLELRGSPNLQLVRSVVLDRLEDGGVGFVKFVPLPGRGVAVLFVLGLGVALGVVFRLFWHLCLGIKQSEFGGSLRFVDFLTFSTTLCEAGECEARSLSTNPFYEHKPHPILEICGSETGSEEFIGFPGHPRLRGLPRGGPNAGRGLKAK